MTTKNGREKALDTQPETPANSEAPDPGIFDLDEFNLVREWVQQPKYYLKYALMLTDARAEVERAKADMELIAAEVDRDIRGDPVSYGLNKVTDAIIKAAVARSKRLAKANARYLRRKHHADVVQAYVNALDHRKRALENLVDLHARNYFSQPREPETSQGGMRRAEEKSKARRALKGGT